MSVKAMAMVKRTPMLAVPGWPDKAIAPNDPIVVSALNNTARGVDVSNALPGAAPPALNRS